MDEASTATAPLAAVEHPAWIPRSTVALADSPELLSILDRQRKVAAVSIARSTCNPALAAVPSF
jgi:hypothetical protein